MRFAANGDSRKEVHTIVKIINILGAQQFARISFEYNRSFQQVEIPVVRVSHKNGGTSEVLPSAVTDTPNPAVAQFPVYQDARVKSVRILGLQEGDTVEYRVITTTTKHPLAPDFWLEHSFDRSGQVLEEHYELNLPAARKVEMRINAETPATTKENTGSGENAFTIYRWRRTYSGPKDGAAGEETCAGRRRDAGCERFHVYLGTAVRASGGNAASRLAANTGYRQPRADDEGVGAQARSCRGSARENTCANADCQG